MDDGNRVQGGKMSWATSAYEGKMKIIPAKLNTEANVRFELCCQLKQQNIPFTLEYYISWEELDGDRGCRFDVAILNEAQDEIIAIIEVKRSETTASYKTGQVARYEQFGVPVYLMKGYVAIPDAMKFAKYVITHDKPPTLQFPDEPIGDATHARHITHIQPDRTNQILGKAFQKDYCGEISWLAQGAKRNKRAD